ncbi:hypothetical protein [Dyadobacter frigoris]|uniref:SH3 domain-containing protein n=1 Tax=Dyadobacter frigoris TaxID=2576211 RepID=A0A4U6CUR8_9BACT|nr:hypothetical protein [Dyadobacter frigoris]TKT87475.1 hypothetical protein FDK13_29610 [Dyadobacter frigoris]GLU52272.1 hypothetical protein Dfri01_17330 [Dyadobacter frigoris]
MKTSIAAAFFMFCSTFSFAQVFVSGVNINEMDSVKVCQVTVSSFRNLASPNTVTLDYGQPNKKALNRITNKATGEKIRFNSLGHVLNFMENNGWVHYDSQSLIAGNESDNFLYFRKK